MSSFTKGMILMWSGQLSEIPDGWALCDGQDGRPNLLGRFVMGVSSTTTNPGGTGGSNSLTLTEEQLPAHTHAFTLAPQNCSINLSTNSTSQHTHSVYTKSADGKRRVILTGDYTLPTVIGIIEGNSGSMRGVLWNGEGSTSHYETGDTTYAKSLYCAEAGGHSHAISGTVKTTEYNTATQGAGSSQPFDNRPLYYELAFIIKL